MTFVWITQKQQRAIEAGERYAAMAMADLVRMVRNPPSAAETKNTTKRTRPDFTPIPCPQCFPPLPKTMAEILEAQAKMNVLRPGRNPFRPAPRKQVI